jgi:hypothetical protein
MDSSASINFPAIWLILHDLKYRKFSAAIWISKIVGSSTLGSAVCIAVCLRALAKCTCSNQQQWLFHLFWIGGMFKLNLYSNIWNLQILWYSQLSWLK